MHQMNLAMKYLEKKKMIKKCYLDFIGFSQSVQKNQCVYFVTSKNPCLWT